MLGQGIGPDGADPERGRVEEEAFVIEDGLEEARGDVVKVLGVDERSHLLDVASRLLLQFPAHLA